MVTGLWESKSVKWSLKTRFARALLSRLFTSKKKAALRTSSPPEDLHLEETVLRLGVAASEAQIVDVAGEDVRDPVAVAQHGGGRRVGRGAHGLPEGRRGGRDGDRQAGQDDSPISRAHGYLKSRPCRRKGRFWAAWSLPGRRRQRASDDASAGPPLRARSAGAAGAGGSPQPSGGVDWGRGAAGSNPQAGTIPGGHRGQVLGTKRSRAARSDGMHAAPPTQGVGAPGRRHPPAQREPELAAAPEKQRRGPL